MDPLPLTDDGYCGLKVVTKKRGGGRKKLGGPSCTEKKGGGWRDVACVHRFDS